MDISCSTNSVLTFRSLQLCLQKNALQDILHQILIVQDLAPNSDRVGVLDRHFSTWHLKPGTPWHHNNRSPTGFKPGTPWHQNNRSPTGFLHTFNKQNKKNKKRVYPKSSTAGFSTQRALHLITFFLYTLKEGSLSTDKGITTGSRDI